MIDAEPNSYYSKIDKHKKICLELTETYARKNADYGDSFGKTYEAFGMACPAIRLGDKFRRFENLAKPNAVRAVADESIEDTLMDLANYAIMTVIEMRIEKEQKEVAIPREV